MKLCGHATLGAASALHHSTPAKLCRYLMRMASVAHAHVSGSGGNVSKTLHFETLSGRLTVTQLPDQRWRMTFPANPDSAEAMPAGLADRLCKVRRFSC